MIEKNAFNRTLSNTIGRLSRRIENNEYAHAFWMRYWDLNYKARWRVTETPTHCQHPCGGRNGRPVVLYHPVDQEGVPLKVGKMLTGAK